MGSRKLFFITAERRRVPPVYPALCRAFQRRRRATLARYLVRVTRSPPPARAPTITNLGSWPAESSLPPGSRPQARMLLTMFLLGLLYVVFIVVLLPAGAGLVTVVVVMGACRSASCSSRTSSRSPRWARRWSRRRRRRASRDDRAALHPGRSAEAEDRHGRHDVPNAFAIGRSQKTATVCATTGIMQTLVPHELEGVMAHELTHVKNRDVLIMTIASFFAALASMIMQFGFFFGGGGATTMTRPAARSSCSCRSPPPSSPSS